MKILSVECSAVPASAAVIEDGRIIASAFVNVKLTHSQTLMPMVENMLNSCLCTLSEIDGFAISAGPGSFTGVRIGISAVKGLAAADKKPCAAVSTLLAIAENFRFTDCVLCAVMDARRNQVYNALFDISRGSISRLCEDRALLCGDLADQIKGNPQLCKKRVIIAGDGADLFFPFVEDLLTAEKADQTYKYQTAVGVGMAAFDDFKAGNTLPPEKLLPIYLRLPQAERELKRKEEKL